MPTKKKIKYYCIILIFLFLPILHLNFIKAQLVSELSRDSNQLTFELNKLFEENNIDIAKFTNANQDLTSPLVENFNSNLLKILKDIPHIHAHYPISPTGNPPFKSTIIGTELEMFIKNKSDIINKAQEIIKFLAPKFETQNININNAWDILSSTNRSELFYEIFQDYLKKYPERVRNALSQSFVKYKEFFEAIKSFKFEIFNDPNVLKLHEIFPKEIEKFFVYKIRGSRIITNIKQETLIPLQAANLEFAPWQILEEISSNLNLLSYIPTSISFSFYVPINPVKKDSVLDLKAIRNIAKRTFIIEKIVKLFKAEKTEIEPFDIDIFPTNKRKTFDISPFNIFTAKNINSAEFHRNETGGNPELKIFRLEELLKTLTHEFMHRIGFENIYDENIEETQFAVKKPGNLLFKESIAEAIAAVLNIFINAGETENFNKLLKQYWNYEKAFSLYQSAKILYLSGFDNFEEFINPEKTSKRVKETTAAVEYHIFKAALIYDLNAFLNITLKETPLIKDSMKNQLIKIIKESDFGNRINDLIGLIKKQDKNSFLFNTGRMTIIEKKL